MQARHAVIAGLLGTAALLATAGPAGAHISPSVSVAPAGSYLKFDLQVPHGCDDGATDKLAVQIPEGINSVTPQVVPGWTIERTTEQLDQPIDDGEGGQITERTSVVTWTGGPLAPDQLEEFGLSVKLPDTPGKTVSFPIIQSCDNGETTEWIQLPDASGEEPEHPAPSIELTASTGDEHGHGDAAADSGDGEQADQADRAEDEDDDGTDPLAAAGLVLGIAGLAVGALALSRTRKDS
jgi:uncharacterized protein YcnI